MLSLPGGLRWGRFNHAALGLVCIFACARFSSHAATNTVTSALDAGPGTFRQALLDATNSANTINFQIFPSGSYTIVPLSVLPPITHPVIIDATTQPGYAINKPAIELDGISAGANAGLRILAGGSSVLGLAINRFGAQGLLLQGPGTNIVRGCYVGVALSGSSAKGNTLQGIWLNGSPGNIIGGTNAGDGNVISGNGDAGIYFVSAVGNIIQGNFIGTSANGSNKIANASHGLSLNPASGNQIGGPAPGQDNVISGNNGSGIYLKGATTTGNLIQQNYVGLDVSGTTALGNSVDGIALEGAPGNTIGGSVAGAGNVISGNSHFGVDVFSAASSNSIQGNFIGTDLTGRLSVPNLASGVILSAAPGNLVGGTTAAARNIISGNMLDGLVISTNTWATTVAGNYIGVDVTGTNTLANKIEGIWITSANSNTVGGVTAGARNVISGNNSNGVLIAWGATANWIQGNYIGTDATGARARPNVRCGMEIDAPGNLIGGASAGMGNLISGNGLDGIFLAGATANGNFIQGNFIGTDLNGTAAIANNRGGVGVSGAPANLIGGTAPGAGNLISGNANASGDAGIYLFGSGATGNTVQGNKLGTTVSGMAGLGNNFEGIYLERSSSNLIGGTVAGAGNVISANKTRGIYATNANWNVIQGNFIGLAADGTSNLGNTFHNVELEANASNNQIGGLVAGAGNRLAYAQSVYCGVRIRVGSTNNPILCNSIFNNGALGIDLGTAATNANVHCSAFTGANMSQNFPILTQAVSGNGTGVRGTFDSFAGKTYRLQFFANPSCDASLSGEGQIYLGDKVLITNPGCTTNFVATLPGNVPIGYVITATATDPANNTSEFSGCALIASVPTLKFTPPATGPSPKLTLAWTNTTSGFVLKQTLSLVPPITWTTVTNVPVNTNGQFVVAVPISVTNRFFTLSFE